MLYKFFRSCRSLTFNKHNLKQKVFVFSSEMILPMTKIKQMNIDRTKRPQWLKKHLKAINAKII